MSNYPAGSENDPRAPWNQYDSDPIDVEVIVSSGISKTTSIPVTEYEGTSWEDSELDDDGDIVTSGGTDYDFSSTNFTQEYKSTYYTPIELIEEFNKLLKWLKDKETPYNKATYKTLLESSEGWEEDDLIVEKD